MPDTPEVERIEANGRIFVVEPFEEKDVLDDEPIDVHEVIDAQTGEVITDWIFEYADLGALFDDILQASRESNIDSFLDGL